MITKGIWSKPIFENDSMWNLNYSDILSQLIQWAGRYTEHYSSDLFIIWKYNVDKNLYNPDLVSFSLMFGFRDMGIDHEIIGDRDIVERHMKENRYYYRKVARLDVIIEGENITMELNEIN